MNQEGGPPPGSARNRQRPVQLFRTLAHTRQTEMMGAPDRLRIKATPVVFDDEFHGTGQALHRDVDPLRPRMFTDVREAFLGNAVQGSGDQRGKIH